MNGNCHFVFGAAIGTALAINIDLVSTALPNITSTHETVTLFILGGLVGSIFPDIDNPNSYMGKLTVPVSTVLGQVSEAFGKTGSHHRGVLHDLSVYLAGLVLSYLYFSPLIGFFIGCLSHLFLDMFNPAGIPFLFGVSKIHLGKIKSGSKESVIFTWVAVVAVTALGILLKSNIIHGI